MTESERDLAQEADMERLMSQQLRDHISPEEATEECAALKGRDAWMEGADLDDGRWCTCAAEHSIDELDSGQCDCCGKEI